MSTVRKVSLNPWRFGRFERVQLLNFVPPPLTAEVQEFAPRLRSIGQIVRLTLLTIGDPLARDIDRARAFAHFSGADAVRFGSRSSRTSLARISGVIAG